MRKAALSFNYFDKRTQHKFNIPVELFKKPINDKEYKELEKLMNLLIDTIRDQEDHPLATVMQIIGENLEDYDDQHHSPIAHGISAIEMVKHLMQKNNLHQKDLAPIFGGQGNVSKFLGGERKLSKKQIIGLSEYFGIDADFFVRNG